jgi:SAM-dependent methyltransferase
MTVPAAAVTVNRTPIWPYSGGVSTRAYSGSRTNPIVRWSTAAAAYATVPRRTRALRGADGIGAAIVDGDMVEPPQSSPLSASGIADTSTESIELLSASLLDDERPLVTTFRALANELNIGLGWHYLLDLAWIASRLGDVSQKTILDAGAGWGVMQWYLCNAGATVISVDRSSRSNLSVRFRARYPVEGLRTSDLRPLPATVLRELARDRLLPRSVGRQLRNAAEALRARSLSTGRVVVYNQDLRTLGDLDTNTIDEVVAVSALEHNPPDELPDVIAELRRVLRPSGRILATLGAARDKDWFHEPSQGWCYTETTLRRLFSINPSTASNYTRYDAILDGIRDSAELRDNLAAFYFSSGSNGMPWGVWNPQYLSVGVMTNASPERQ